MRREEDVPCCVVVVSVEAVWEAMVGRFILSSSSTPEGGLGLWRPGGNLVATRTRGPLLGAWTKIYEEGGDYWFREARLTPFLDVPWQRRPEV
jgi:hypothetical protein